MNNFIDPKMILAALILCGIAGAGGSIAAEKKPDPSKRWDAERKEAEEETRREDNMTLEEQVKMRNTFRGLLQLQTDLDGGNPDVVGLLNCIDDGKVYLLKVENKDTLKILTQNDRKKVSLVCRTRNGGKYLLVVSASENAAGPVRVARRSLGGL